MKYLFFSINLMIFISCQTIGSSDGPDQQIIPGSDLAIELAAIKKNYSTLDCYFAKYSVKSINSDGTSQTAEGLIRADILNKKMVMELSVPYIGYKLSRMVINDDRVYINDIYNKKKYNVALKNFALGGLTNSALPLPFYIFSDVLYARLPEALYGTKAKRKLEPPVLSAQWKTQYENYIYEFNARRLARVQYHFAFENHSQDIQVNLTGKYKESIFPRKIQVDSINPSKNPDQLFLEFSYIDTNAKCLDSHFQAN